jgi:predicted transposase/invertase (TIGR01784 family)
VFDENIEEPNKYRYNLKLSDTESHQVFYDKLTFIYLEMPKFNKTAEALSSKFDKWMYVIRNLSKLDKVPNELRERVFERLFEVAEIAKFSRKEADAYEESLKSYRDLKNSLDTAYEEGVEKGREEGREEEKRNIVENLIKCELDIPSISKATGLTESEVQKIKDEMGMNEHKT